MQKAIGREGLGMATGEELKNEGFRGGGNWKGKKINQNKHVFGGFKLGINEIHKICQLLELKFVDNSRHYDTSIKISEVVLTYYIQTNILTLYPYRKQYTYHMYCSFSKKIDRDFLFKSFRLLTNSKYSHFWFIILI